MSEIAALTDRWKATKAALESAQAAHLQSENDIYNAVKDSLPTKGTTTLETGMKVVTGFSEKWDQEAINRIYQDWPATHSFPFKGEWKADGKAVSHYRDNEPGLYLVLSEALTVTPKKPAFSMKGEKESS